jgi:putative transcriptional regulator
MARDGNPADHTLGHFAVPLSTVVIVRQPQLRNHIRRWRFDRNEMTQQALAERVGVTRQTIIALEADKYAPSLLLAFRIARALGTTIEQMFQYD